MSEKRAQADHDNAEPPEAEEACQYCEAFLCGECGEVDAHHVRGEPGYHAFVTPRGTCEACIKEMKAGV